MVVMSVACVTDTLPYFFHQTESYLNYRWYWWCIYLIFVYFQIWTISVRTWKGKMASASSTSARNLFQDSKTRLSDRVQVCTTFLLRSHFALYNIVGRQTSTALARWQGKSRGVPSLRRFLARQWKTLQQLKAQLPQLRTTLPSFRLILFPPLFIWWQNDVFRC